MKDNGQPWKIYGNPTVLKRCVTDPKFAHVVALARAVNALNSAHSLMMSTMGKDTPAALRDRMNSYFFISGILYEVLKLIRAMSKVFGGGKSFEKSLRLILRDPSGQMLEQMHFKSVRHGGVFHFLPDRFADAIAKTRMTECVFTSILGERRDSIHHEFADWIAAEMMIDQRIDDATVVNKVVNNMMEQTLALVKRFIEHSESFIADQLIGWGFEVLPSSPAAPGNQSQG